MRFKTTTLIKWKTTHVIVSEPVIVQSVGLQRETCAVWMSTMSVTGDTENGRSPATSTHYVQNNNSISSIEL